MTATNTWVTNGLLSRRTGGTSVFYQFDPQGSVTERENLSGGVLTTFVYDAHGVGTSSAATTDPYAYGAQWGYYTDRETGLLLLSRRFYDPGTGRFLNRDPIGNAGGVNLYSYVGNGPVNRADPSGEKWKEIGGIAGGILGGLAGLPEGE